MLGGTSPATADAFACGTDTGVVRYFCATLGSLQVVRVGLRSACRQLKTSTNTGGTTDDSRELAGGLSHRRLHARRTFPTGDPRRPDPCTDARFRRVRRRSGRGSVDACRARIACSRPFRTGGTLRKVPRVGARRCPVERGEDRRLRGERAVRLSGRPNRRVAAARRVAQAGHFRGRRPREDSHRRDPGGMDIGRARRNHNRRQDIQGRRPRRRASRRNVAAGERHVSSRATRQRRFQIAHGRHLGPQQRRRGPSSARISGPSARRQEPRAAL